MTMTPKQRVIATLTGQRPDRIPRTFWAVPGFEAHFPGALREIETRYPLDAVHCAFHTPPGTTRGDPFAPGEYVDEWGCTFFNVHPGIAGQVKAPRIATYDDLAGFQPPWHLLDCIAPAAAALASETRFTLTPHPVQPFERLQFLRGTEALLRDLVKQPAGLMALRETVHSFYLKWIDAWCQTPVDCVFMADDWGTQRALIVSPRTWRALFKPLYAEYIARAKAAGKFTYMHSDGYILDILDDLIEIGLDAVNAQVTCMPYPELSRRFRGKITFWGQMDRQYMLCFGTPEQARRHVHDFYGFLAAPNGSRVLAQMHIEPTARPENIAAVLDEFEHIHLPESA